MYVSSGLAFEVGPKCVNSSALSVAAVPQPVSLSFQAARLRNHLSSSSTPRQWVDGCQASYQRAKAIGMRCFMKAALLLLPPIVSALILRETGPGLPGSIAALPYDVVIPDVDNGRGIEYSKHLYIV